MPCRQPFRAFTLPELLITLSVLGIILGFAVPSLHTLLQDSRRSSERHLMHASLNYARGMALQTQSVVSLCSGQSSCNDSRHWRERILIFVDRNGNGLLDEDEQLLKVVDIDPRHRWHWSNFRQQPHMSFSANGMTDSLNGTFTLCDEEQATHAIVINITGRARYSAELDHERCRG